MSIGVSDDESTIHFDYTLQISNPFKNPEKEAKSLSLLLLSSNWEEQIRGCEKLRRLVSNHPEVLIMNTSLTNELVHNVIQVI